MNPMADVEALRAACCVAGLDGEIEERERKLLERLAQRAGVGSVSLRSMMETAVQDRNFYEKQFRVIRADPDRTIKTLLAVAVVDGELELEERVIIQYFADALGMTRERCDALIAAARSELGGK